MTIFNTIIRLLSFRLTRDEMVNFNRNHFLAGLIGTWVVGIGRYWDDPGASLIQHLGLGSVIYIFLLSFVIWLIIKPLNVPNWKYFTVVTFIGLTSFPAVFYAIPVERFFTLKTANSINMWFLLIVATWRLLLFFRFTSRCTDLGPGAILTVTLMPICLIISVLTFLNLHRVVFDLMGGVRDPTAHDSSYVILSILTVVSMLLSLPLVVAYGVTIYSRRAGNKSDLY